MVETVWDTTVLTSVSLLMVSLATGDVTLAGSCLSDWFGEDSFALPSTVLSAAPSDLEWQGNHNTDNLYAKD